MGWHNWGAWYACFQIHLTHALLTVISFHSFGCAGTFLPLMVDPHKVLDYDNWWNKSLGNIKPYQIPPLSQEVLTKLHNQLDASSDRIWRTRPAEEATKIVALLRDLINSHTETQTYKFSWNLSLYRNPPKKANKVTNMFVTAVFQSFLFKTHNLFFNWRWKSTQLKKLPWLKEPPWTMLSSVHYSLKRST